MTALVDRALDGFVADVREVGPPRAHVDVLPDGTSRILYRVSTRGRVALAVLGPQTRAVYKQVPELVLAVTVVFRPGGAYPFFGVPLDELVDRWVPARELWGARADQLRDELVAIGAETTPALATARRAAIERVLVERLRGPDLFEPAAAGVARAAVRRLAAADAPIRDLAATLGVSDRNLRRAFVASVGMSPKRFARILRFRRAAASAAGARGRWADVARATGYSDQAHLIADFHALAGVSPAAFAEGQAIEALRSACSA